MSFNTIPFWGMNKTGVDPDAQAFIDATGITDETEQSAIDSLVKGLKADSLWTKMLAVYPFVGGTSTTNKYNLKDPRDLDAAFRLTFFGGITHTNGFLPNGTNGYANTHIIPSSELTEGDVHMSVYVNTDTTPIASDPIEMGCFESTTRAMLLGIKQDVTTPGVFTDTVWRFNGDAITTSSSGNAFSIITRDSTSGFYYKDGVETKTYTANGTLPTTRRIFLGNVELTGGGPGSIQSSNQRQVFTSIGSSLDASDAANLYTRVQAFQTALGRNN